MRLVPFVFFFVVKSQVIDSNAERFASDVQGGSPLPASAGLV